MWWKQRMKRGLGGLLKRKSVEFKPRSTFGKTSVVILLVTRDN